MDFYKGWFKTAALYLISFLYLEKMRNKFFNTNLNTVGYAQTNVNDSRTSLVIASVRSSMQ
jgi:hypothetical protein